MADNTFITTLTNKKNVIYFSHQKGTCDHTIAKPVIVLVLSVKDVKMWLLTIVLYFLFTDDLASATEFIAI